MEQIKTDCIDNGKMLLWLFPFSVVVETPTLQMAISHYPELCNTRSGPTSCWPELMQLAVRQLPATDSSLCLFLLDGIVPQQLLSIDKKRVPGLNYQLPSLF